jgi:ATP-dependent exoDNAse (exonuclease V) alpha subunit
MERFNKPVDLQINPTKLLTHNANVDSLNSIELKKLSGESIFNKMMCEGVPSLIQKLKESLLVPEVLELRIGAVVMFVRNNFEKGYANGTIGKVIAFTSENNYPIIRTLKGDEIVASPEKWLIDENNEALAVVYQVPLRLAWAITVHKSQGMSLDCAEIDLSRTFEYGMGYVALSRVRSLGGIKLLGLNKKALEIDDRMIKLDKELIKKSKTDLSVFNKISEKVKKSLQKDFLKTEKEANLFA